MQPRLILGQSDIDRYVKYPAKLTPERTQKIHQMLSGLEGRALNIEQFPLKLLRIELAQFQVIDPLFLAESQQIEFAGRTILLPKFSVYRSEPSGFKQFKLHIDSHYHSLTINNVTTSSAEPDALPQEIGENIAQSLEYAKSPETTVSFSGSVYYFYKIPKLIRKKYDSLGSASFSNQFHGIIPEETRRSIDSFKSIFGEKIFLVAETKPSQWARAEISKEAMLLGFLSEQKTCYFLQKFETVSIAD